MIVPCRDCGSQVDARKARQKVTLWSHTYGHGGTLSDVVEQTRTDEWRCDSCQREREATKAQGGLL